MTDELVRWLAGLEEGELAALLEARPDVLRGIPPQDLTELAERLAQGESMVFWLQSKPVPYLQVTEASLALGQRFSQVDLTGLLADAGPGHSERVDRIVDDLVGAGLLTRIEDRLTSPDGVSELFAQPLGLGSPARVLLEPQSVDSMRRLQVGLGLRRATNRAGTLASMLAFYADADAIRAVVASAPAEVADRLGEVAAGYDDEDVYEPRTYARHRQAVSWAVPRGLMIPAQYSYDVRMPAEVALALRGPDYRAPFAPAPPTPTTHPVAARQVESSSAAAATQFADHVLAVLDHVARAPLPSVKTGGVGARELAKLAKTISADERDVRLVLELADAAGLLARNGGSVRVSAGFERWRGESPATRLAALIELWWTFGAVPTTRGTRTARHCARSNVGDRVKAARRQRRRRP